MAIKTFYTIFIILNIGLIITVSELPSDISGYCNQCEVFCMHIIICSYIASNITARVHSYYIIVMEFCIPILVRAFMNV